MNCYSLSVPTLEYCSLSLILAMYFSGPSAKWKCRAPAQRWESQHLLFTRVFLQLMTDRQLPRACSLHTGPSGYLKSWVKGSRVWGGWAQPGKSEGGRQTTHAREAGGGLRGAGMSQAQSEHRLHCLTRLHLYNINSKIKLLKIQRQQWQIIKL